MAENAFKGLLDIIFLGCKGLRVLISLVCYEDESGIHDRAPVFSMAGWVAPQEEWLIFDERWRATLKNARLQDDKGYHATDCEGGYGAFKGWSVDRRRDLTVALVDAILSTRAIGCGIAIRRPAPSVGESLGTQWLSIEPYSVAIPMFLGIVQGAAGIDFTDAAQRIACVFERQKVYAASTQAIFDSVNTNPRAGESPLFPRIKTLIFGDPIEHTPLQAADLLAFEIRKHYEVKYGAVPARPERRSFARLRESDRLWIHDASDASRGLDESIYQSSLKHGGIKIRRGGPGSPKIFVPVRDEPETT